MPCYPRHPPERLGVFTSGAPEVGCRRFTIIAAWSGTHRAAVFTGMVHR